MIVFRRAQAQDLDAIHTLAMHSGIGMTTLTKSMDLLTKRLTWSNDSFKKAVTTPSNEYYLFVLEDTSSHKVVGTSAIEASIGDDVPFYSYKLSKRTKICHQIPIRTDYEVLNLVNDYQGSSELCTLFLEPDYRVHGNGLLLSLARLLFMANYPERFASTVIAEMRGVSDDEGHSPFWDQIGATFFQMSFAQADHLTLSTDKQFIADLMPKHPLYVALLHPSVQAVIGKPHPSTLPAMNILLSEGFHWNHYVDIFDAGPTIECPRDQIRTLAKSQVMTVKEMLSDVQGPRYLLANTSLDYRAMVGQLARLDAASCALSHETAAALQVKQGDTVRLSTWEESK
jgi:arginine N-succinyltransferase